MNGGKRKATEAGLLLSVLRREVVWTNVRASIMKKSRSTTSTCPTSSHRTRHRPSSCSTPRPAAPLVLVETRKNHYTRSATAELMPWLPGRGLTLISMGG